MVTKAITISGRSLMQGLFTESPSHTLPFGAAEYIQNVDFSRIGDRIPKRMGIQIEQASRGAGKITGYHQFVKSDGTKVNFAVTGNDIYSVSGGVWTSRFTGAIANTDQNFVTFQNLCYTTGENTSLQVSSGAAFSAALGGPPSNGKFICVWQNRLWIFNTIVLGSRAGSRAHYSADSNGQDWTTLGAAGYIDINPDDGDSITGAMPLGNALYVFKNRTIYRIQGTRPDNYVAQPVILARGCVAPRSIVGMGPFIIYMSQYGIHSLAPDIDGLLTAKIYSDIEALTKTTCCAGKFQDTYTIAFDSNADGLNDKAYVLDLRSGAWSLYTNVKANVFCTQDDGALLSGGSDLQIIRKHNSGEDDEGSAIDMIWRSGKMGFDDFTGMKYCRDLFWNTKPISGKTLTARIRVDGVQVDEVSTSISPHQTSATDEDIKIIGYDGPVELYGRFIQVEFRNNELAAPIEISEFSVSAVIESRQITPT